MKGIRYFRSPSPLQRKCVGVHSYVIYDTTERRRQRPRRDQYRSLSEYVLSNMIQQTFDKEDRIKARWKKKSCIYMYIHGAKSTDILIFTRKHNRYWKISISSHDSPFIFNSNYLIDSRWYDRFWWDKKEISPIKTWSTFSISIFFIMSLMSILKEEHSRNVVTTMIKKIGMWPLMLRIKKQKNQIIYM